MITLTPLPQIPKPFKYRLIEEFIFSDASPLGLLILDKKFNINFSNQRILDLLNLKPEDLNNQPFHNFFKNNKKIKLDCQNLLSNIIQKRIFACEMYSLNRGKAFEVIFAGIGNESNKITHILCLVTDISEKKKLLEKIKLAHAHLTALIKSAPVCVIILDEELKIIHINHEFTKTFGHKLREIKGNKLSSVISPKGYENETKELSHRIKGGETLSIDTKRKNKKGIVIDVNLSASRVQLQKKTISYIILIKDITAQKIIEQELLKAKEEAESSDKIKTQFLAQMSHEIRTPINLILTSTNLIKEILEDTVTEEVKELFGLINTGSSRIVRTIDLILNMAEIESQSFKPIKRIIDLDNEILKRIVYELSILAKSKNIELSYTCNIDHPTVNGDFYSISQIFFNLIDNAIKYTNKGSVIVNVIRNAESKIAVEIADTGIGISEEFQAKLFTPFLQESTGYTRRFEGNGLGLSLVKKYCEYNSAEIYLKSYIGVGSTFSVIFN